MAWRDVMKMRGGAMTALATPFREGKLDEAAYEWLVEYQVTNGISTLIPMGTTGEASTMTAGERRRALEVCLKANKGRAQVFAGASSNDTAKAIANVTAVRKAGADGALVVTPYYNKPTQAGLIAHYRLIAQAHPGFPLMAYNVPSRTGVDMLPDTVQRLTDIPEVVALKEATGNMLRALELYECLGDTLVLLSGDDSTVAPFILCGGRGVVSVSSNVVPQRMTALCAAARDNDAVTARRLQLELQPLHRILAVESNPTPVKWALHLLGAFSPEIRPPLLALTEKHREALKDTLEKLGLSLPLPSSQM